MATVVTYRLTGAGWAECIVEIDSQRARVTASYLSDALGDLLRAVADVLAGAPESTAIFAEEPGEYRWRFHRVGSDRLSIRVLWFAEWSSPLPDERGEAILDAECRRRTFAGAVLAASQRVLRIHGTAGYAREWGRHPFPSELQERLKQLLG